jgi:hypothetical protein
LICSGKSSCSRSNHIEELNAAVDGDYAALGATAPFQLDWHIDLAGDRIARTPVSKISKQMKRSVGSLRQKALKLGIGLGHQR